MTTLVHSPTASVRFPRLGGLAAIAVLHMALAGAAAWAWLMIDGVKPGWPEALGCAAPALLALLLATTSQADRRQYVARLVAATSMLPILLMMWAGSQEGAGDAATAGSAMPAWVFFVAFAVAHALAFVGSVWWCASTTTRVEPGPLVVGVAPATLSRRIASLAEAGLPLTLERGAGLDWVLHYRHPEGSGRRHRLTLNIDAGRRLVHAHEFASEIGARPQNDSEASLRSGADPAFDPSRPQAQRISGMRIQTTLSEPERLAALQLRLHGDRAEVAADAMPDGEAMVTLLCALVTRSGFVWQPVLKLPARR